MKRAVCQNLFQVLRFFKFLQPPACRGIDEEWPRFIVDLFEKLSQAKEDSFGVGEAIMSKIVYMLIKHPSLFTRRKNCS